MTNTSSTATPTKPPMTIKISSDRDPIDNTYQDATRRNYIIVSSPSPFKLPPKLDDYTPKYRTRQDDEHYYNTINDGNDVTGTDHPQVPTEVPTSIPTTTKATAKPDDQQPDQNEIAPTTSPRKRITFYEFSDEPIGTGNFATAPTTLRQRIKSRIAQYRGSERYQGVTMMKIVRKRPVNDQSRETLNGDGVLRSTTPMTQRRRDGGKKLDHDDSHSDLSEHSNHSGHADQDRNEQAEQPDDTPTTLPPLSPSRRAQILSKISQAQNHEDFEGNEISVTNKPSVKSLINNLAVTNESTTVTTVKVLETTTVGSTSSHDELDDNEITVTPTNLGQRTTRQRPQASRSSLVSQAIQIHKKKTTLDQSS